MTKKQRRTIEKEKQEQEDKEGHLRGPWGDYGNDDRID